MGRSSHLGSQYHLAEQLRLTEATETILVFVLMCLLPAWFPVLAYFFAGLCLLTTVTRVVAGIQVFNSD